MVTPIQPEPKQPVQAVASLFSEWKLASSPVSGKSYGTFDLSQATLRLTEDGKVSGYGGCNSYFGNFSHSLSDRSNAAAQSDAQFGTIAIGALASTKRACFGGAMSLEGDLLRSLSQVTGWTVQANQLILSGPGVGLIFQKT